MTERRLYGEFILLTETSCAHAGCKKFGYPMVRLLINHVNTEASGGVWNGRFN